MRARGSSGGGFFRLPRARTLMELLVSALLVLALVGLYFSNYCQVLCICGSPGACKFSPSRLAEILRERVHVPGT